MALTDEEASAIKQKLLEQLSKFPQERQEQVRQTVENLSTPEVEQFIQENALDHLEGNCIFCAIVGGKNPSFKLAESEHDLAILELNPLSKGHALIVPKHHADSISDATQEFAKRVAQLLTKKLSPEKIQINKLDIMGHALLEVVPLFGGEKERRKVSIEELTALQEELTKVEEPKIEEPPKEEFAKNHKTPIFQLPARIP